jgi:hypothetical protein
MLRAGEQGTDPRCLPPPATVVHAKDMTTHGAVFATLSAFALVACSGGAKTDPRYPPRAAGCEVQIFNAKIPGSIKYDDLGRVDAICGNDISEKDCLRELQDQACKLGGDLLYDVPTEPARPSPDKVKYNARAAHTRIAP